MIDTRKQAENAFGKGLVMDSHPINADNNTLSNCLNGTLVTYNGNEMMLQNDMGNGRVETAYLPPGYVPIGIKEHGGIIYVASYNPLTNHGQLGSFPSPERNISSDEMGNSPNLVVNKGTFGFNKYTGVNTLYSKISILDDSILRPGDKFSLSFKQLTQKQLSDYITAYNNSGASKILKLTVSVRDNNGNLQDITNDLKRFSNDYYMQENENLSESTTVDDLRNQTQNENFNIYSGRLSGELYLVAELATIQDYELSISGNIEEATDKRTLKFKGDFKSDISGIFKGVQVSFEDDQGNSQSGFIPGQTSSESHEINISEIEPNSKLKYSITPLLTYAKLNNMTKSGILDMSLFGTGKIELNEWRYYNDLTNNKLVVNWGMNTYLRNDDLSTEMVTNVAFNFFRFENNQFNFENTINTKSRKSYNGNFIENISYDDIPHGQIYVVQLEVSIIYNGEERVEYFYKFLFTSEYFNRFYSDGETTDFEIKEIQLEVKSNSELTEKRNFSVPGTIKQSPTYTMLNQPTFDKYQDYQFYYIANQTTTQEYELKVNNYLSYDSFDYENETWDFPFVLNQKSVKSETSITNSKAVINDVVNVGNFITDIEEGKEIESTTALTDNYVSYTNELKDGLLSININTVSQYLAEQTSQQVNAGTNSGFRGYMCEDNLKSIFGYVPEQSQARYGVNVKVGRNNSKGRLNMGICEFYGDNYTADSKGKVLATCDTYRTDRDWKTQWVPAIMKSLQECLSTSPNVFFIIGGDTDKWGAGSNGNSLLLSRSNSSSYTKDYNIVLWKGYNEDQMYYMLNQYFSKTNGSTTYSATGLQGLINIFKHIYTKQDFVLSGTMYKSGNYSYTQDYKVNYEGTLTTKHQEVENINKLQISDSVEYDIEGALNHFRNEIIGSDNMTSDQLNKLRTSGNTKVLITLPESAEHQVSVQADNIDIDNVVIRYTEATGSMSEGALQGANGELIENDFKGNPLSDQEMYYIGGDGLAYPISNPAGLTNSSLASAGVDVSSLNSISKGFRIQYDNVTKSYQIRVNPNTAGSFTKSLNGVPRISSDNRPFEPAGENGQGGLLNIKLTSSPKLLR